MRRSNRRVQHPADRNPLAFLARPFARIVGAEIRAVFVPWEPGRQMGVGADPCARRADSRPLRALRLQQRPDDCCTRAGLVVVDPLTHVASIADPRRTAPGGIHESAYHQSLNGEPSARERHFGARIVPVAATSHVAWTTITTANPIDSAWSCWTRWNSSARPIVRIWPQTSQAIAATGDNARAIPARFAGRDGSNQIRLPWVTTSSATAGAASRNAACVASIRTRPDRRPPRTRCGGSPSAHRSREGTNPRRSGADRLFGGPQAEAGVVPVVVVAPRVATDDGAVPDLDFQDVPARLQAGRRERPCIAWRRSGR